MLTLLTAFALAVPADAAPPNVLFIAVDDLRPELGCYGVERVHSPHIDRLAAEGTAFRRAYCQQAVCNPSRASLMTGRRPDSLKVYDLQTDFRKTAPDAVSIPQHFRAHGYLALRVGKIYHLGHGLNGDPQSWDNPEHPKLADRYGPENQAELRRRRREMAKKGIQITTKNRPRGLPWAAPEVDDDDLSDGSAAKQAVAWLKEHGPGDKPWFIAAGFYNPHLPFVAPKKYWDLYDPADIELPSNTAPPENAPSFAATDWGELRVYQGMPKKGPLSEEQAREAVHGYLAATSYVDALVGRLLDTLDELDLRKNTVVVLWGDHGWQLGDHGFWCKHTNYDVAARSPLIVSAPGQATRGVGSDALVEFVDVFPTLTELCGLPTPGKLEGLSLVPLLNDPALPWKSAAFHLYPRGGRMGRAIRTDRWHLVEWEPPRRGRGETAYELYDLTNDPAENTNLAGRPDTADTLADLTKQLHAGWRTALPVAD